MKRETPYPMMDYYRFEDAGIFFGREEETFKMVGEILSTRLLVLFSPSGSGKTSLIHAGVRPKLEEMGYTTAYTRLEGIPDESVRKAVIKDLEIEPPAESLSLYEFFKAVVKPGDKPVVVFFDQFEEFFIVFENDTALRQRFITEIGRIKYDEQLPVFMVFSLREDYYASLHEFRNVIPSIFQDNANLRLGPFTDEKARRVLEEPLKKFGCQLEEGLTERILCDLNALNKTGKGIEPMWLQLVCGALWEGKNKDKGNIIDNKVYCSCGGAENVLMRFIQRKLEEIPGRKHGMMVKIFDTLKTPDNTKRYRSLEDIETLLKVRRKGKLVSLLKLLSEKGILREEERGGSFWYEFRHDLMVPHIVEWMEERKEKRTRRNLLLAVLFPIIIIALIAVVYYFIRYNTYYAMLSKWENTFQEQEIIIERGFNPFKERIETGYFKEDVIDPEAEDKINKRFYMGTWNAKDWRRLEQLIKPWLYAELLYKMGEKEQAIQNGIRVLKDESRDNKDSWSALLVKIGKRDIRLIDALLNACTDKEYNVRSSAVGALVATESKDPRVLQVLLNACTDKEYNVRSSAVEALETIENKDPRILQVLLNACTDGNEYVRSTAVEALEKMQNKDPRVLEALINACKDKKYRVSSSAVKALIKIDSKDPRVLEVLLNACKDKEYYIRSSAVEALRKMGNKAPRVLEALLNACKDESSNIRSSAVVALGNMDNKDPRGLQVILNACKDKEWSVRSSAVVALGNIGNKDSRILEALLNACKDKEWSVHSLAVVALGTIESKDPRVLEVLLNTCKDSNYFVRSYAVEVLVRIESKNPRVLEALLNACNDENEDLRSSAIEVLVKIESKNPRVLEALLNACKDKDYRVRSSVVGALGNMGNKDPRVLAALLNACKDKKSSIRSSAVEALGNMGNKNPRVLAALLNACKDKESSIRSSAVEALGNMGNKDLRVLEVLLNACTDKESSIRSSAVEALGKVAILNHEVGNALRSALKNNDNKVRINAAQVLGKLYKTKPDPELLRYFENNQNGYRLTGVYGLASKDSLSPETLKKINELKDSDPRPWVRLAAWKAFELIEEKKEKK